MNGQRAVDWTKWRHICSLSKKWMNDEWTWKWQYKQNSQKVIQSTFPSKLWMVLALGVLTLIENWWCKWSGAKLPGYRNDFFGCGHLRMRRFIPSWNDLRFYGAPIASRILNENWLVLFRALTHRNCCFDFWPPYLQSFLFNRMCFASAMKSTLFLLTEFSTQYRKSLLKCHLTAKCFRRCLLAAKRTRWLARRKSNRLGQFKSIPRNAVPWFHWTWFWFWFWCVSAVSLCDEIAFIFMYNRSIAI